MTVNTLNITSGPYIGNSLNDTYSYDFRVDDKTQLSVYETTDLGVLTLLVVDTDYTVNNVGVDGGGTIVRLAGDLPTDYMWYIRSNYIENQLTDFSSQGAFFPDIHEAQMDHVTFLIQQLRDASVRSIHAGLSEAYSELSFELPLIADREGKILSFNSVGDVIANTFSISSIPDAVIFNNKSTALAYINSNGIIADQLYIVTSDDGGMFVGVTGAPVSTYADDGGSFCGTQFIDTGGDGSESLVRKYNGLIDVKWFGVTEGGVADNAPALNLALASGDSFISEGVYAIKSNIDFKSSLIGVGNVILQQIGFISQLGTFNDNDVTFENVTVKGSLSDGVSHSTNFWLEVVDNVTGVLFKDITFTDLKGIAGVSNLQYALSISLEGTDVEVINCKFKNIQQEGSNPPAEGVSPGFCGGIFCESGASPVTVPSRLIISGCLFEEIATVKNPAYVGAIATDFDADAIRFFAAQTDYNTGDIHNILVEDCRFINVQKRAIKNSAVNGLTVNDIFVEANNTTESTRPAMASIVGLQPAANCKITNVKAIGKFIYLFRITSSDTMISNVQFDDHDLGYINYVIGVDDQDILDQKNNIIENFQIIGAHTLYREIEGSTPSYEIDNFVMRDIELSWKIPADWPASINEIFRLANMKDSRFENINVYAQDGGEISADGIYMERCDTVKIDNLTMPCSDKLIEVNDAGSAGVRVTKNLSIINSEFLREGTVAPTVAFIDLPSTAIDCFIGKTIFNIQSTVADTNLALLRARAAGFIIDGCDVNAFQFGANAYLPFGMIKLETSGLKCYNHRMFTDGTDTTIMLEIPAGSETGLQIINCHSDQIIVRLAGVGQVLMNCSSDDSIINGGGSFTANGNNLVY